MFGLVSTKGLRLREAAHTLRVQSAFLSRRQQHKVVIDVHHWHVKGGDLVDAQGLMHGRVQLLHLELPLHSLHGVEGSGLVLLAHQQTRLQGGERGEQSELYTSMEWPHSCLCNTHGI